MLAPASPASPPLLPPAPVPPSSPLPLDDDIRELMERPEEQEARAREAFRILDEQYGKCELDEEIAAEISERLIQAQREKLIAEDKSRQEEIQNKSEAEGELVD